MLISKLIKIANALDYKGLTTEANEIDDLILRLAMTRGEALGLLGLSPAATKEEINIAFKSKALKTHPDLGGNEETMKHLNVARDVLLEDAVPEIVPEKPAYREPEKKVVKEVVSFEDAAKESGVPSEVKWKFKTDTKYSPILGDLKTAGFVIYGATDDSHVFVGVFHRREQNYFTGTDRDIYRMWVKQYPLSGNLADLAPIVIRELWIHFDMVKGYGGKVELLPEGKAFNESLFYSSGRSIAFKDAMSMLGATPITWSPKGKLDVVLELSAIKDNYDSHLITLVISGKEYPLSEPTSILLCTKTKLLRVIFGDYSYDGSKKNITKMRKANEILSYLSTKLEGKESEELINLLKKSAEQTAPKAGTT